MNPLALALSSVVASVVGGHAYVVVGEGAGAPREVAELSLPFSAEDIAICDDTPRHKCGPPTYHIIDLIFVQREECCGLGAGLKFNRSASPHVY